MAGMTGCRDCGDILIKENMTYAYFRKDGTKVPKSICKGCTTKQRNVRAELERDNPHPREGSACQCCNKIARLNLDHCHASNRFRGWLCRECNLSIGLLGDSRKGVCQALVYLLNAEEKERERFIGIERTDTND
jgi:hypothetical protein